MTAASTGLFTFPGYTDLGEVFASRLSAIITATGDNPNDVMSTWVDLADVLALTDADPSQWSVLLEERHSSDDPATPAASWSEWAELQIGAITARAYQFRIWLYSLGGGVTPVISDLLITIDMPDRIIAENDLAVGTGGLTITFTPSFRHLSGVAVSVQGQVTGDTYAFGFKDETGFSISFKNAAGSAVARTFDYVAKGYGKQLS